MSVQLNPNKTFQAAVNSTTTEAIIYMKTLDMEGASSFDYYIPSGLTATLSISSSDSSSPTSMVWTAVASSVAGATRSRYNSASFTAIKIDRNSGAGLVELTISAT